MSKGPECDMALLRAVATDPEAKDAVTEMMQIQDQFSKDVLDEMYESAINADIPAPGNTNKGYWDKFKAANSLVGEGANNMLQLFKTGRVSSMLSNPLTQIKNFTATGGHALIVRPLEEAYGIAVSRLVGKEKRELSELYHYTTGSLRGAQDAISIIGSILKSTKRSGSAKDVDVRKALRQAGYDSDLATGKQHLIMGGGSDPLDQVHGDSAVMNGARYIASAVVGNQFSMLQAVDTGFKVMSHRAKVQQLLSRQGMAKKELGETLDDYVVRNWQKMSDQVKRGKDLENNIPGHFGDNLYNINRAGIDQAAEDTFTQTPQTDLGKLISGNFEVNTGFKRIVSESMQIIAPFRNIYVNLMRQTFSRRLVPFFDKKTMAELTGKMGPEMQQTALARTAGAYTLLAGTAALVQTAGIKIWGADDVSPEVRDMQFQMHGKVGNTVQIGDQYFPVDMLPPSIAIPLGYIASGMEAMDEFNYRYHEGDDKEETFMKAFQPFLKGVVEGPWVTEYMDFLSKTNGYLQRGDGVGLGDYIARLTVSPIKPPAWISEYVLGADPYMKTTDGMVGRIMTDFRQDTAAYGHKRNMFGRKIKPLERMGDQAEYPWFGGDTALMGFLGSINYDKVYGKNISKTITGDAKGKDGVEAGADDHKMTAKERDLFEYYVGQFRVNDATVTDEIAAYMNIPGIYDEETGRTLIPEPAAQEAINAIYRKRRKIARQLIQYHPQFGIREKQIEDYSQRALQNGIDPHLVEQQRRAKLQQANEIRMQLQQYF